VVNGHCQTEHYISTEYSLPLIAQVVQHPQYYRIYSIVSRPWL